MAKNGKGILLTIGAFLLLSYVVNKKQLFKSANVTLKGLKFAGSLLQPEIHLILNFVNNTKQSATITGINGTILLNDSVKIGDINKTDKIEILPDAVTEINLPIDISYNGIVSTIKNLIQQKTGKYTFNGFVNLSGLSIPVNLSQNF